MNRHASRYNKRDANETSIVNALHELGCIWLEGPPLDGWVFLREWVPVEIKSKGGRLTDGQQDFVDSCKHCGRPFRIWRSANDAVEAVLCSR